MKKLEKYRKEHPIADKDRIGYLLDASEGVELDFEDIFSDEAFERNNAYKNNRSNVGNDDFGVR